MRPMHGDVRQANPGTCPKCGMSLVPENTRFPLLRHMTGNWNRLATMALLMAAIMMAVIMYMR
jgi:hypothetical protein